MTTVLGLPASAWWAVAATLVVMMLLQRRLNRSWREQVAGTERHGRIAAAALAVWIDQHRGDEQTPAPGTVALYALYPHFRWPHGIVRPTDAACPFPDHVLHVVNCAGPWGRGRHGYVLSYRWAATCTRCGAHWTEVDEPPAPSDVVELVRAELARNTYPSPAELGDPPRPRRWLRPGV